MSRPANRERSLRTAVAAVVWGVCALLILGGCGAQSTFVSTMPPPDTAAEAWYTRPVPEVRAAVSEAMTRARIAIDPEAGGQDEIVGTKQQVPYVGRGAGEPPPGPMPVYLVTATITRPGDLTRVVASIEVVCPSCKGKTPYEWQYPGDLFREVFEGARKSLSDTKMRTSYPPRHTPIKWRSPRRY